jgi:hypothetical protein
MALKRGRSSVVERQLPKLNVVGSIPIARSNFHVRAVHAGGERPDGAFASMRRLIPHRLSEVTADEVRAVIT